MPDVRSADVSPARRRVAVVFALACLASACTAGDERDAETPSPTDTSESSGVGSRQPEPNAPVTSTPPAVGSRSTSAPTAPPAAESTTTTTVTTAATTVTVTTAAPDPTCPAGAAALLPEPTEPVRIIFDTDFAADVDDAGALAVLHALADAGDVEILAVIVSDGGNAQSHRAIDAINTYYGRPDVPIGVVEGPAPAFPSSYVDQLAAGFPNDVEDPPAALDVYRRILAGEPDDSVTIVSVGYLTNLDALLSSQPDASSEQWGTELVSAKVQRWIAMGGAYPDSVVHPFGAEFNFVEDSTATLNAVADWPTPAVFSGWEVGDAVLTGAVLQQQTPENNPVREAYRLFSGGADHRSWDLTAVLVAARGTAGLFEICAGRNLIGRGGSNTWEASPGGRHGYLRLLVPPSEVAAVIDDLLIAAPVVS